MKCPTCAAPTAVTETRALPYGVRRRRHCSSITCAQRLTTVEVVVPSGRPHKLTQVFVLGSTAIKALQAAKQELAAMLGEPAA